MIRVGIWTRSATGLRSSWTARTRIGPSRPRPPVVGGPPRRAQPFDAGLGEPGRQEPLQRLAQAAEGSDPWSHAGRVEQAYPGGGAEQEPGERRLPLAGQPQGHAAAVGVAQESD